MITSIALLKARAGLSREEFIDYYENHHVPLILSTEDEARFLDRTRTRTWIVEERTGTTPGESPPH